MREVISIRPIGTVKNNLQSPPLVTQTDGLIQNALYHSPMDTMNESCQMVSEIVIDEKYSGLLDGIEGYSHLIILYWGHEVPGYGRNLVKIHPAGMKKYPEQGIFATCSPARPNPVLITVVSLLKRENSSVWVCGLDAIDMSPVIDIKPYVQALFPQGKVTIPDWMTSLMNEFRTPRVKEVSL